MQWLQTYTQAWNDHDPAAVTAFMTADVVYVDNALGERLQGAEAVRGFVRDMSESFSSDHRFTTGLALVTEDRYAFEWVLTGTHDRTDETRGMAATGRTFTLPGISIGRVERGWIAENHDYWNLSTFLGQVGLMPEEARV